jgi:3-oxoadipate enol-lactonase
MTEQYRTIRIDGPPAIAVSAKGTGDLVLFLHGIGGNRSNWSRQLDAVGRNYLAVAWDARGYGDSDDYDGETSFDIFADDVLRVLDHFGAVKAHLCGLSLGGRIAQRVCSRHPDRVASLILADTRPDTADTRSPEEREAFLAARAKPLLAGKTAADIADGLARGLAGPTVAPAALQELVTSISRLRTDSYLKTIRANLNDDFIGSPAAIDVPTLILVGERDTLTPPALSRQLAETIPGAEMTIIRNAGHVSNLEQPDQFNMAVLGFLDGLDRMDR